MKIGLGVLPRSGDIHVPRMGLMELADVGCDLFEVVAVLWKVVG